MLFPAMNIYPQQTITEIVESNEEIIQIQNELIERQGDVISKQNVALAKCNNNFFYLVMLNGIAIVIVLIVSILIIFDFQLTKKWRV
jgi:hypothetical protein